jgi:hypothetical protein
MNGWLTQRRKDAEPQRFAKGFLFIATQMAIFGELSLRDALDIFSALLCGFATLRQISSPSGEFTHLAG